MNNNDYAQLIKKAADKIKELTQKLNEKQESGDIAVLGYSCRFPGGANSPELFWKLLKKGYDAVSEIPEERFPVEEYYDSTRGRPGKTYTKEASFLTCDIKKFDNNHFEMSEMEATSIDPQHRLLLEVTWEALENSGINIKKARGSKTGVYVGLISSEYGMSEVASDSPYKITPYSLMGNYINSASGRISYYFDFKGPCMAIDTACSSSMSALNEAVVALKTHQCNMAVVGGANLLLTPNGFVGLSQVGAISEDGRCRAFDSAAHGYGRSEGCGVIVLKRLSDAERDNDNIQAVIKSVNVMHGGRSNGFFAPNGLQEQMVMLQALQESGLSIGDVDYIEAHGTGTVLGDAIEAKAIYGVYAERQRDLYIGSVKTNIGHMEAAAGMASLIKVLLSIKNEEIPASIHYNNPNKECVYPHLKVVDRLLAWKRGDHLRAAGISSFGISGTLSHVILQEYHSEARHERPNFTDMAELITLSAQTRQALSGSLGDLSDELDILYKDTSLGNLAFASNLTRSSMNCRFAAIVHSKRELSDVLQDLREMRVEKLPDYGEHTLNPEDCRVVFSPIDVDKLLKNDQIKRLMAMSSAFRKTFIEFDDRIREQSNLSVFDRVYGHTTPVTSNCDILLQLAVHCAFFRMMQSILPQFGEYTARGIGWLALEYVTETMSIKEVTKIAAALDNGDQDAVKALLDQKKLKVHRTAMVSGTTASKLEHPETWIYGNLFEVLSDTDESTWTLTVGEMSAKKTEAVFDGSKESALTCLKQMYLSGLPLDWHRVNDVFSHPIQTQPILSGYHFNRRTYWNDPIYFGGKTMLKAQAVGERNDSQPEVTLNNLKEVLIQEVSQVSGIEPEDIETDRELMAYGFESISLMKLVGILDRFFRLKVQVKDFYERLSSIDEICAYVSENYTEQPQLAEEIKAMVETEKPEEHPMSTMQARIYTEHALKDSVLYDLVGAYSIEGEIDFQRLERCANQMLRQHKVLCTALTMQHGEFCMRYMPNCRIRIRQIQQSEGLSLEEFVRKNLTRFDIEKPPLMEIFVIEASNEKKVVVFHFHHAISDGVSMNLYASEFMRMYHGEELPAQRLQYWDYVRLEQSYLSSSKLEEDRAFWLGSLVDTAYKLPLPYDFRDNIHDVSGSAVMSVLDKTLVRSVRQLCAENRVSPFTFFQVCTGLLLHRLSFEDNIAIAIPVSCRNIDFMNSVGMFTNTVAVARRYDREKTFIQMLRDASAFHGQMMQHISYPYNLLAQELGITAENTLNVLFVYENTNSRSRFEKDGTFVPCGYESDKEPFDLNFELMEHDEIVDVHLRYRSAVFARHTVERIGEMYRKLISTVLTQPDIPVGSISLVNEAEMLLLEKWSQGEKIAYDKKSIPEMFDEQVAENASRTAVCDEKQEITYAALWQDATRIAKSLVKQGVAQGDVVGLFLQPGVDMIRTILGVLYAGAVYLPISGDCPKERRDYILSDSGTKLLITDGDKNTAVCAVTDVDTLLRTEADTVLLPVHANMLAYIIYTSGTTGQPKGVLVEHSGVGNLREYFRQIQKVDRNDRTLQFASYAFDAILSELCMSILSGGTLYIVPPECRNDPARLEQFIENNRITICVLPPIILQNLSPEKLRSLRTVITAGSETTKKIVDKFKNIDIYSNDYGPTEATVCATYWKHLQIEPTPNTIPIGRPMCNKQVYILNGNALCGPGLRGELCVAGDGIARGYLGLPELTAQKFVRCPFSDGRMYRTGDVARWLPDGNIEFLGRIDSQVKLRGYRIELGEIEMVARGVPGIRTCAAVLTKDLDNEDAVVLYFVSDKTLESSEIYANMRDKLPDYMLPSYYIEMEALPLNRNGKIDRASLPKPSTKKNRTYVAPTTETEKKVSELMAEVLKMQCIGITDNFFENGGQSLRAMILANRISESFGRIFSYRMLYENSTPQSIAKLIEGGYGEQTEPLTQAPEMQDYELGFAQKRIYSVTSITPEGTAYNMPQILRLQGRVDPERLRQTVQSIVDAHSVLRTAFRLIDGKPRQVILPTITVEIPELTGTEDDVQEQMDRFVRPFDLSNPPLFRMILLNTPDASYLLMDFHHIICDGMSLLNFSKEFVARYNGEWQEAQNRQFIDYCQWMKSRDISTQGQYWKSVFTEIPEALNLPTDFPRPKEMSYHGDRLSLTLSREETSRIDRFAVQKNTTPYVVFLSSLMILLQRYSGGKQDIVIGSPVSGRTRAETEKMLGMFVNTLAIRGTPRDDIRFDDFLREVSDICIAAYENQEYPFDMLIRDLSLGGNMSGNPLFDVMLAFQNNEQMEDRFVDLDAEVIPYYSRNTKFELTWNVDKKDDAYCIDLEYCVDLFTRQTAERMGKHFVYLLRTLLNDSEKLLGEHALILPEERELLTKMNSTTVEQLEATIPELFDLQVRQHGETNAIVLGEQQISYKDLNKAANGLAWRILARGIGKGDFVAIMADRSVEFFAAVLGVLKSGAAYVPIDPGLPEERIRYILSDCKPKLLLQYCDARTQLECIPTEQLEQLSKWAYRDTAPETQITAHDAAYCIYTSGTTGKPKGVLLEHSGVSTLLAYFRKEHGIGISDRTLQFANYSFDASVSEMTMGLLSGATMYIVSDEIKNNFEQMSRFLANNGITAAIFPPQYVRNIDVGGMRLVITAGSESSKAVAEHCTAAKVYSNDYGPTEVTVCATFWKHKSGEVLPEKIPIGHPLGNKRVYIMNGMTLCGCNIPGELCVGGSGLAIGYLGQPTLTEEKFIRHPETGERLYRTGDLARMLPDGNIDFLGRIDSQVKIRGFRVELGEIEQVVRLCDAIEDCAVTVYRKTSDTAAIIAYAVTKREIAEAELRTYVERSLPEYMLPTFYVFMDSIPYNRSGKVDKALLPEPTVTAEDYQEPKTEMERAICEGFACVLGIKKISRNDSFFQLGGDSIQAISVVSKLENMGYSLTYHDMMLYRTPADIAPHITPAEHEGYGYDEVSGAVSNTPMLRTFAGWNLKKPEHFNQSIVLKLENDCSDYLEQAISILTKHHDILRAIYRDRKLWICGEEGCRVELYQFYSQDKTAVEEKIVEKCALLQKSFVLTKGPLFKAAFFKTPIGNYLMLCAHHLVIDRISWNILAEDLQTCMDSLAAGKMPQLPEKTASLLHWERYLNEYSKTEQCRQQATYWQNVIHKTQNWRFPADSCGECGRGKVTAALDEDTTNKLLTECYDAYHAYIPELIMAAISIAVKQVGNLDEMAILLENNGRQELHHRINLSRSVGWFTNTYLIVIPCKDDVEQAIVSAKEAHREVLDGGMAFSVCDIEPCRTDHCISFNYLGTLDTDQHFSRLSRNVTENDIDRSNHFQSEIDLSGSVAENKLSMVLSYDKAKHSPETMQKFADSMIDALRQVVTLCSSREKWRVTKSDIAEKGIGQNEFDEIMNMSFA